MTDKFIPQIISAAILVVVAIALINPFHFWMPTMAHMTLLGLAVAVFGIFNIFVFAERPADEREELHTMHAGRWAFLMGGVVLLLGIVIQGLSDTLDPWLVWALLAMVFTKVCLRLYSAYYQ
jgi:uncharacterized membrane protein